MVSLYSEAYKPPLKLRFTKLSLQFYSKLKSQPSNPPYDCTFNPKHQSLFEHREKTFGLLMKHILEDTYISLTNIHYTIQLSSPLWLLKQPVVILNLSKLPKNKTHPLTYQEKLNSIQERYPNHLHIFTDGSKSNNGTRCGAVLHKKTLKKCLPKWASIFSAEIYAINLALKLVSTSDKEKFLIHSDSISVLQSSRAITPVALLRSLSGKYPWERYEPPYSPSNYG